MQPANQKFHPRGNTLPCFSQSQEKGTADLIPFKHCIRHARAVFPEKMKIKFCSHTRRYKILRIVNFQGYKLHSKKWCAILAQYSVL